MVLYGIRQAAAAFVEKIVRPKEIFTSYQSTTSPLAKFNGNCCDRTIRQGHQGTVFMNKSQQ
jgi:hypothetical protein